MKTTRVDNYFFCARRLNTIFTLAILFAVSSTVFSQGTAYTYDAVGNRIKRKLVVCTGCLKMRNTNDTIVPQRETEKAIQIAKQHGISVYPNPANEMVNIAVSGVAVDEKATVYILDETGRTITSFQGLASPSQVDMKDYKAGIYFVKVSVGNENLFYRVIKP